MDRWKNVLSEKLNLKSIAGSTAPESIDLSNVPDSEIWDGLPKHLRNKKKVTYIRNHSDLKVCPKSSKFMLLLWKDWQTMKRRWFVTLVEVLTPVIAIALLTLVVSLWPEVKNRHAFYNSFSIKTKHHTFVNCTNFVFSQIKSKNGESGGGTSIVEDIMHDVEGDLGPRYNFTVMDSLDPIRGKSDLCAAIVFNFEPKGGIFPVVIDYTIRMPAVHRPDEGGDAGLLAREAEWDTSHIFPSELITGPRNEKDVSGGSPGYFTEGFLYLQNLIAESIIHKIYIDGHSRYGANKTESIKDAEEAYETLMKNVVIHMNRFPYPAYKDNRYVVLIHDVLPLTIVIAYCIPFILMVYGSVVQKESGIRLQMKTAGIPIHYHRIVWIIRCVLLHMPAAAIITGILATNWTYRDTGILTSTNPIIFFLLIMAYLFKTICICMFLVTFFKRASTATASCGFLWIVSYIPYYYVKSNFNNFNTFQHILASILGNTAISLGCHLISDGEAKGFGVHWETLFLSKFSLGYVILILFLSGGIEIILSAYISRVLPEKGVRALPWYYLIRPWYWRGHNAPDESFQNVQHLLNAQSLEERFPENFEQETHLRRKKELQVEKLSKYFDTERVLNKINLNCYEGYLTAIIGEEGCGKSTLLTIIAGLEHSTTGSIVISRQDMEKQNKHAMAFVGYCSSVNVFYPYLTVEETLLFYCKLKCVRSGLVQWDEVNRFVSESMLTEYRTSRVTELTYGAKRILMIACAFIGGSRVVLLDDPTRNMNAAQKRITWEFIARQKKHRAVIVAMDCMNESDTVVDRIVCLQHGESNTAGSIRFLQLRYGGGYHLIIERSKNCDIKTIRALVQRRVANSCLTNEGETELDFYLPEDTSSSFPGLFEELKKQKDALGIAKIRNSYITLDEVLMNVKRIAMETDYDPDHRKAIYQGVEEVAIDPNYKKLSGNEYLLAQFMLLFDKSLKFTLRRRNIFIMTTFVPIIFVTLASLAFMGAKEEPKPLSFDFRGYITKGKDSMHPEVIVDCHKAINEGNFICANLTEIIKDRYDTVNVTNLFNKNIVDYVLEQYDGQKPDDEIPILGIEIGANNHHEDNIELTGYFNNQPLHVPPLAMVIMDNALFDYVMTALTSLYPQYVKEMGYTKHVFRVTNHPMEYTAADKVKFSGMYLSPGFFIGVFSSLGFALLVASFVILPIQEQHFRHLQMLAGANPFIFWTAHYSWNFLHFTCVAVICSIIICVLQLDHGFGVEQYFTLLALFECYGLTTVIFVGTWSLLPVAHWGLGFSRTYLFFILTGPIFTLIIIALSDPTAHAPLITITVLHNIFLLFPSYALIMGIFYIIAAAVHKKECGNVGEYIRKGACDVPNSITRHPFNEFERRPGLEAVWSCCINLRDHFDMIPYGIGRNLACMAFVAICALGIRFLKESRFWTKIKQCKNRCEMKRWEHLKTFEHEIYDYDVLAETFNVTHGKNMENDLIVKNLAKEVPGYKKVDNLCFHVSKGRCFCLVGVAGAGKSTTMGMMVGSKLPTAGDVTIRGISLMKNYSKFIKLLGYCPGRSPFLEELTGHEVLYLIGGLRRIPKKELQGFITNLSLRLLFLHDLDNEIKSYNRISVRKLSAAVAMLGDPEVIVLDEPTRSIDLISREYMFKYINTLVEKGTIVILSSQTVVECEAVCSDMAIMVNGTLRCFGTPDHLRKLFSEGFTIIVHFELDVNKIYFTTLKDKVRVHERHTDMKKKKSSVSKVASRTSRKYLNEYSDRLSDGDISLFPERSGIVSLEVEEEEEHDLIMSTWEEDLLPFVGYFERNFPEAILVDKQPGFVHYHIRERYANVSTLFTKMEEAKVVVSHIETYYIGESNLDQVFVNFARGQKPHG